MQHPETLLFIDHDQSEIFEGNILPEQAVRADHDIDGSIFHPGQHLLLLLRCAEATEQSDSHGIVRHAFA